jgi:tetratricopeptide (TPR) repeat protein
VAARGPARSPRAHALAAQAEAALREGAFDQAAESYRALVGLEPRDIGAWYALATIALRTGQPQHALEPIGRALSLDRKSATLHSLHAVALGELGRYDEAEAAARRAVVLAPADAGAHYNLGKILLIRARLEGAIAEFRRSIALDSRAAGGYFNLALSLDRSDNFDAACEATERGLRVAPDDPWLLGWKAAALERREGPEAAVTFLGAQLERLPALAPLHFSLYNRLLALGRWREAWPELLWRSQRRLGRRPTADEYRGRRLPERLDGERVLLVSDWGLGDFLFFGRFAPALRARGAQQITLRVPVKLLELLRAWDWAQRVPDEGPLETAGFDRVEALEDLPALLAADAPAPAIALPADAARRLHWSETLRRAGPPPYIGVTWRAGTDSIDRPELADDVSRLTKKCPIEALGAALAQVGGTLVVLQRQPRAGEIAAFAASAGAPLCDLSEINEDLPAMAAVLSLIDDYVGVSNTNMHLQCALGGTARVLVPFPPEGKWGARGESSPWFPGFSVYREVEGWDTALGRLRADLLAAHGQAPAR